MVQNIHDGQAGIKTNKVSKGKGTHRHGAAILHHGINVVSGSNTSLKGDDSLVDVGHKDSVGNKTGESLEMEGTLPMR